MLHVAPFWEPLLQDEHCLFAQNKLFGREVVNLWTAYFIFVVQVRHPNVLALRDTLEVEEKGCTSIYIITEPVTPLIDVLEELDVAGPARCVSDILPLVNKLMDLLAVLTASVCCCREEFVAMGLFHIAKAVGFLNNDCKLVRFALQCLAEIRDWGITLSKTAHLVTVHLLRRFMGMSACGPLLSHHHWIGACTDLIC